MAVRRRLVHLAFPRPLHERSSSDDNVQETVIKFSPGPGLPVVRSRVSPFGKAGGHSTRSELPWTRVLFGRDSAGQRLQGVQRSFLCGLVPSV